MALAAFTLGHSLHACHSSPLRLSKRTSRTRQKPCLPCRSCLSTGPPGSGGEEREEKGERKEEKRRWGLAELYGEAERLSRGLKERLSPREKGDWKDLVLMSLSFAVYIYISQKIVCAYCAWMSMLKSF